MNRTRGSRCGTKHGAPLRRPRQVCAPLLAAAVGLAAHTSLAGPLLYQDLAGFDADIARLSPAAHWTEGFESAALENYKTGTPGLSFFQDAAMTVSLEASRFSVTETERFVTQGERAIKAVPGGWGPQHGQARWEQLNNPGNNTYGPLRLSFTRPIHYLALDVTDLGTSDGQSVLTGRLGGGLDSLGAPLDLLTAGAPHSCIVGNLDCNNAGMGMPLFFGIRSATPFQALELGLREGIAGDGNGFVLDDFVGFDNLRFGTLAESDVPVTGSLWLTLSGLCLLGMRRRAAATGPVGRERAA